MFRLRLPMALLTIGLLSSTLAPAGAHRPADATQARAWHTDAPLEVAIYDRTSARLLPIWRHRGELHVAGESGHEYEIHLRSTRNGRVLAVTSVDGVNVVTGRSAAIDQPGYVIDGGARGTIDGWRKNLGEVASFVFTTPRRSYAARTGRPDDVGVIGIAMFHEAEPSWAARMPEAGTQSTPMPMPMPAPVASGAAEAAAAPGAEDSAATRARRSQRESTAPASASAPPPAPAPAPELGTGHGRRRDSQASHTTFERASPAPAAVVRIYYDSLRNLVARGVVPAEPSLAERRPDPFPADGFFVPDP